MRIATIFENGQEFDGGSVYRLVQTYFAHPVEESEMFHSAMLELKDTGEFEFVLNNKVYLITLTEIPDWMLTGAPENAG